MKLCKTGTRTGIRTRQAHQNTDTDLTRGVCAPIGSETGYSLAGPMGTPERLEVKMHNITKGRRGMALKYIGYELRHNTKSQFKKAEDKRQCYATASDRNSNVMGSDSIYCSMNAAVGI